MDGSTASMLMLAPARYPRRSADLCMISFLPLRGRWRRQRGSCSVKPYLLPASAGPSQSLRDSSPARGEQINHRPPAERGYDEVFTGFRRRGGDVARRGRGNLRERRDLVEWAPSVASRQLPQRGSSFRLRLRHQTVQPIEVQVTLGVQFPILETGKVSVVAPCSKHPVAGVSALFDLKR